MADRNTVTLSASDRGLRAAAALLRAGELVAFPTETVYGLGADARDPRAVAAIFAAKGRPAHNPLIVHVADLAAAEALAAFAAPARELAERFWPGPLTLVLPRRGAALAEAVTAGLPTVALRVPDHPLARDLLAAFGGPLAAPSANRSGRVSATTREHVLDGLGGRIAAVLDGGPCPLGLESTIIGFEGARAVLLRPGGLPVEGIGAALGRPGRAGDVARDHRARPARLALCAARRPAPRCGRARAWRGLARLRTGAGGRAQPLACGRPRRGRGQPLRAPACRRHPGGGNRRRTDRRRADPAGGPRPRAQRPPRPRRRAAHLSVRAGVRP